MGLGIASCHYSVAVELGWMKHFAYEGGGVCNCLLPTIISGPEDAFGSG